MTEPDLLQEGNRRFSVAMIALESGDFGKSERLLRETIDIMGKQHPVSLLAMKTLAGIASEQGRFDDALQVSLDLLDAQIATFGVNHSESSRTVRSILDMCTELGQDQIAQDISMLVQAASEIEKIKTTQSLKRLRTANPDEEEIDRESLRYKIYKWFAQKLAKLLKLFPFLDRGATAAHWSMVGALAVSYGVLACLGLSSPNTGVKDFRRSGTEYATLDERRKLQFTSPFQVIVQFDSQVMRAPFRVIGYDWHDIGTVLTSSILERETWLIQRPEGLRDFQNNVYYRADAPEKHIIRQMREVMHTSNHYYQDKGRYPKTIEQISETKFQYHNPFSNDMDFPSIQSIRLDDRAPEAVADFFWTVNNGGRWPEEPVMHPGAIHACRVSYVSSDGQKQRFFIHGGDRYGAVMTASEGVPMVLQSESGKDREDRAILRIPQRIPKYWVFRVPPQMMPDTVPYLQYRYPAAFGVFTILFLILFLATPGKTTKASAAVLTVCFLITFVVSLVNTLL